MKDRIFRNWTFARVLYLVLGALFVIQSMQPLQWAGILFGSYFAAMGLFAFGCAGGNCYVPPSSSAKTAVEDVEIEEIK